MADKKLIYESRESLYARAMQALNQDSMIVQYAYKIENFTKAAEMFEQLEGYEDAADQAALCRERIAQLRSEEKEYLYQQAMRRMEDARTSDEYDKAAELFGELTGFRDSDEKKEENLKKSRELLHRSRRTLFCWFGALIAIAVAAVLFLQSESWRKIKAGIMEETYVDSRLPTEIQEQIIISGAKAGDTVKFGSLSWIVLTVDEESALLAVKDPETVPELKGVPYQADGGDIYWETSSLRAWLNNEFPDLFLTQEEQALLNKHASGRLDNPMCAVECGPETEDLVGLLSIWGARHYRKIMEKYDENIWLCSPGDAQNKAAFLASGDTIMYYGYPADSRNLCVCPVIEVICH